MKRFLSIVGGIIAAFLLFKWLKRQGETVEIDVETINKMEPEELVTDIENWANDNSNSGKNKKELPP